MTGFRVKFENEQTHLVCNEASKTDYLTYVISALGCKPNT